MSSSGHHNTSPLVRNISYSLAANLTSFLVGVAVVLVVPKAIGVEEYGYFQLFLFFISYVGFFHFGWADGIVLRYAGERWEHLSPPKFAGQIHFFLFFELSLWGLFALGSYLTFGQGARFFVLLCTAIGAVLVLSNTFLRFILQATNRIKTYASLVFLERLTYLICVMAVLFSAERDFRFFVLAYLLAQSASLLGAVWFCRDIVFVTPESFRLVLVESTKCVLVGIKLMLANIASLLILGIIRFAIEREWGIATFGKISLLLSMVSILFVFVNAASLALLPALRREDKSRIRNLYLPSRLALSTFLLFCCAFWYPATLVVTMWLPAYSDALGYLPLILPICLFESSASLLIATYLKVLRLERDLLLGNLIALGVSIVLVCLSVIYFKNLVYAVLSMPIALAVRSYILEFRLTKKIKINTFFVFFLETSASIVLVCTSFFVGGYFGSALYFIFLICYVLIGRKSYKECWLYINKKQQ